VLRRGQREVTDHVQRVAAADRPPRHDRDDGFGHEPDQALDFEDVEPSGLRLLYEGVVALVGLVVVAVLVSGLPADRLVAAGTERPPAVLLRRPVPGEQHAADISLLSGVI